MSSSRQHKSDSPGVALIASRYEVLRPLGRGGMATVFEVYDRSRDERVAIKRLEVTGSARASAERLFELEYHTLCELRHPSIVEAHEFGRDELGPFYSMELMTGSDLRSLAPLPWQRVCVVLMEICSALSLLHSRRFVHRDVTPRNIFCRPEGRAKLLDFGAVAVAGPSTQVVGTPPFLAPEVYGLQSIDGRADLYALGATAYFALTGRHAYPAASLARLPQTWANPPATPSALVPGIPSQLDELVMALLALETTPRPRTAAEVMQRLAAIAQVSPDQSSAAAPYLATPLLVGREAALGKARAQLAKANLGHGQALVIEGPPGSGRTRLLQACVLQAKLAGRNVLRMARAAEPAPWTGAQSLLQQLREVVGDAYASVCPHSASLSRAFGRLGPCDDDGPGAGADGVSAMPSRGELMTMVGETILGLAVKYRLAVAVDDIETVDEPSAALVALLGMRAAEHGLWSITTSNSEAARTSAGSFDALKRAATRLPLRALDRSETRELLESVFGGVPRLDLVADRLYRASQGSPRSIMQLAQHLLDANLVMLRDGAFVLPEELEVEDLPGDAGGAYRLQTAHLGAVALGLAEVIALCPQGRVALAAVDHLGGRQAKGEQLRALQALQRAGFVLVEEEAVSLVDRGVRAALLEGLSPHARRAHCLQLAELYSSERLSFPRAVDYLVRAGQLDRALDLLLSHLDDAGATGEVGEALAERLALLPTGWVETCDQLLCHGLASDRPRRDIYRIRAYLFSTALLLGAHVNAHVFALLEQLAHDSGLDLHAGLEREVAPAERLGRALTLAQERFDGAHGDERVLSPGEAIPLLGRTTSQALASMTVAADPAPIRRLPDLSPLAPLSPAMALMCQNVRSVGSSVAGFEDEGLAGYRAMVARLEEPDGCGFDPHAQRYIRLSLLLGIATQEVNRGRPSCLSIADELESDPLFVWYAWNIRMLYAVVVGDRKRADACRRTIDFLSVQHPPKSMFSATIRWFATMTYMRCEDLLRIQECETFLEVLSEQLPAWRPRLQLTRAVYQRVRGDYAAALREIEVALALVEAGEHSSWAYVAAEHATILRLSGEVQAARAQAHAALAEAERLGLGWAQWSIGLALGLAELELGNCAAARQQVDAVIAAYQVEGTAGVLLGSAYDARARVAIAELDAETFQHCLAKCAEHYRPGESPELTARYERLVQHARAQRGVDAEVFGVDAFRAETAFDATVSSLSACRDRASRAERALEIALSWCDEPDGLLYLMRAGAPELVAQRGHVATGADMDAFVRRFLAAESGERSVITVTVTADGDEATLSEAGEYRDAQGGLYSIIPISHTSEGRALVTGVLLVRGSLDATCLGHGDVLGDLSRALAQAGDTSPLMV